MVREKRVYRIPVRSLCIQSLLDISTLLLLLLYSIKQVFHSTTKIRKTAGLQRVCDYSKQVRTCATVFFFGPLKKVITANLCLYPIVTISLCLDVGENSGEF